MKIPCGLQDHAGLRLAALALDLQLGHLSLVSLVGMMGAEIDGVQIGALAPQKGLHFLMDGIQLRESDLASCHHGLIGDDDGKITRGVDSLDGLGNAIDQSKILNIGQKSVVTVKGAVPVEEDRLLQTAAVLGLHLSRSHILCDRPIAIGSPHILDVFGTVVNKDLSRGDQRLEDVSVKVGLFQLLEDSNSRRILKDLGREQMDAGVDAIAVPEPLVLLVKPVGHPPLSVGNDDAAVIGVIIGMGKEGGDTSLFTVTPQKRGDINIKNNIAVEQQKILGEPFLQKEQRARRPERGILDDIVNRHAKS